MSHIEIKHRDTGSVLYGVEAETLREAIEAAVKIDANLRGADLSGADLSDANLSRAKINDSDGEPLTLIGQRPIMQVSPIGSRSDYLLAWMTDRGVYISTGCFWGSLDGFRRAVAETHGDGTHAREYYSAIALIECHAALWPAETAAQESAA